MEINELIEKLKRRKCLLENKLESKKKPHLNGVNPIIINETEAKLEEIERVLSWLE